MFGRTIALIGFAWVTVFSCGQRYEPDPKFSPAYRELGPGERRTPAGQAVDSIANTRCDQEVLCDNVGAHKRYTSRDRCLASFEPRVFEETGLNQCHSPIDQRQLSVCLNSIRILGCSSLPEDVYVLNGCQSALLCQSD